MAAGAAIHVEAQGQAVFEEGAREKVEVGGQVFGGVDAGADAAAAAIIEHVEQREHGTIGPPAVRGGVELPERADLAALPAAHGGPGLGRGLAWSESVGEGKAADGGGIDLQIEAASDLAGGEAVAGGRAGGEQLAQQRLNGGGPGRGVIAAGDARLPAVSLTARTGTKVVGIEFVETGAAEAEFGGGGGAGQLTGAEGGEDFAGEGRGDAFGELLAVFFIAARLTARPDEWECASAAPRPAREPERSGGSRAGDRKSVV